MIVKTLLFIATIFLVIAQYQHADVTIALMKGFVIGAIYHKEQYDDGFNEYTLQCMLGCISLTVVWERSG